GTAMCRSARRCQLQTKPLAPERQQRPLRPMPRPRLLQKNAAASNLPLISSFRVFVASLDGSRSQQFPLDLLKCSAACFGQTQLDEDESRDADACVDPKRSGGTEAGVQGRECVSEREAPGPQGKD